MMRAGEREREFLEPMRALLATALYLGAPLVTAAQVTRVLMLATNTAPSFRRVRRLSAKRA